MAKRLDCFALCLALCLAIGQAIPNDGSSRIWGGEDAGAGDHPWVVSVRVNNVHKAMGSIISRNHILTVAHSVSELLSRPVNPSTVSVRAGSLNQFAGGVVVSVKEIHIHPSFGNFLHDIAILETVEPLTFNNKVNSVRLPEISETNNGELPKGTPVNVQGWGELLAGGSSYKLQKGSYTVLSPQECDVQAGYGYESVLCLQHAEKQGACRGDDGAGVVSDSDNVLYGIHSFVFGNCGTRYPDVASKVVYYREWIRGIASV